jgi:hypothetical protein
LGLAAVMWPISASMKSFDPCWSAAGLLPLGCSVLFLLYWTAGFIRARWEPSIYRCVPENSIEVKCLLIRSTRSVLVVMRLLKCNLFALTRKRYHPQLKWFVLFCFFRSWSVNMQFVERLLHMLRCVQYVKHSKNQQITVTLVVSNNLEMFIVHIRRAQGTS